MARCPSCDYPLSEDRERLGSRCPSCRDPLYDPPNRLARPVRTGEPACSVHPGNESIGTCARCGNGYCETCRSRWANQVLCVACVERILASGADAPEQVRSHFRQALLSLVLGLCAWLLAGLAFLVLLATTPPGGNSSTPAHFLFIVVLLAAGTTALFGVGQGAAALRIRGKHMILATSGLILGGLYVGILMGFLGHRFW